VTSQLNAGTTYYIRVRARNYWGWGDFSDIMMIKASTIPGKVAVPTTTIDAAQGGVRVVWIAPNSNSDLIT
jgi:hypothetical protein